MRTAVDVREWTRQSAAAPSMRIPGCRESDSPRSPSRRLRLSDPQRSTLAEIGKRLERTQLAEVACVAKPDTILAWYRRLIARNFDGSKRRSDPGRPRIDAAVEALIVRLARENSGWGYDRIVGALANLGHQVSDQTVGNTLKRYGISPAPQRKGRAGRHGFLHGGGFDLARSRHLLGFVK